MWSSVYPIAAETKSLTDPKTPLFVDIGGNVGHSCAFFKHYFSHVPGRVILQDLEAKIAVALKTNGVENIAYNFFDPQPMKGKILPQPCYPFTSHNIQRFFLRTLTHFLQARNTTHSPYPTRLAHFKMS